MQNLIRFYAVILIVVITVFSIFVSTIIIRENVVWSKRATLDLSKQVSQTVMNYSSDTNRIYAALFDEPLHYNDLFDYMELSPADYYRKKIFDPIYTFYPRKVHDVYDEYPALSSVNVHVQAGKRSCQAGPLATSESQRSLRQRSAMRLRSSTRCGTSRLLRCSLMATPAWPAPMISVSTFSTVMPVPLNG